MIYLAYGSNINSKWMADLCPTAHIIGSGVIKGAKLFYRGKGYLNLEFGHDEDIPVLVWEIDAACEKALDQYEEYPSYYEKQVVEATVGEQSYLGMIYLMTEAYAHLKAFPKAEYVKCVQHGYAEQGFDLKILERAYSELEEGDDAPR